MKTRLYQLFRRPSPAPAGKGVIALMVVIASLCTGLAIQRVRSRHELVSLGYELAQADGRVRELREARRKLEVERATLSSPERVRALATQLGMVPVPADQIRVVHAGGAVALAGPP
ncbi:MAG TPA: cell division protein FtsL [Kofleriaceae bacterium]|nr:cell division protein FtsL [Kofleriaceae bacterium]